jgi:DNA polymerase I-like protein with 3'-5' exonuclease and polymerase domains/uracil-DNA glycosylase
MVVGEAPGKEEDEKLQPFVGASGHELERMLSEAGFITSAIRYTNVIRYKPWDNEVDWAFRTSKKRALEDGASYHQGRYCMPVALEGLHDLQAEIAEVKPQIIIGVGGTALWGLTGKDGIENWRSSQLKCNLLGAEQITVIPTYHPASILRAWENRHLAIHDFKRANRIYQTGDVPCPPWNFRIRPDFKTAMECLDLVEAAAEVACDIETKKLHIACVAFAWNKYDAICIPFFIRTGAAYWSEEEELILVMRIRRILDTHNVIGQNFHYDSQYFSRRMLVIPRCSFDTLLAQHVLYPGTPKSLAHNSSLYCPYHVYWKDDGKEWDPKIHPEEQLWSYNCVDAVKTLEVKQSQQFLITKHGLQEQFNFLMRLWPHVLNTMLRGVNVDKKRKAEAVVELDAAIAQRQKWLDAVVGRPFNPKSPKQMAEFLIDELGLKGKKGKKTKGISFDKKNVKAIGDEHILLWPFTQTIEEIRSLGVFNSTFAKAPLDMDGRMRCLYNEGGAETFRFSSSENAFYTGTNLQNIPTGDRSTTLEMPNMRSLFIPDETMEIAEVDLAGADAQVVAWECDDEMLKAAFRAGEKIHAVNAKALFGGNAGPDGKKEPYYTWAKQGVHLTNYLGRAGTLAKTIGVTTREAELFQKRWFDIHPNIPKWHARIEAAIRTDKTVRNKFGFRRVYFERADAILSEAVAWIPQSTVAITINYAFIKLMEAKGVPVEVLMQVHDSLVFQYPARLRDEVLQAIHPLLLTPVPYPDPLIIQLSLKVSTKSWGDCKTLKWAA